MRGIVTNELSHTHTHSRVAKIRQRTRLVPNVKLVVSGGGARTKIYVFLSYFKTQRVGGERSRVQLINGNIKFRYATGRASSLDVITQTSLKSL